MNLLTEVILMLGGSVKKVMNGKHRLNIEHQLN